MKTNSSISDYRQAWPFFEASVSYVFDRRGTCGDSQCKLTKLAAAFLGDKLNVDTVVRHVNKLSPDALATFQAALSYVDPHLRRYEEDELICWIGQNSHVAKLYTILYFYRCVSRPCNSTVSRSLLHVKVKLRILEKAKDGPGPYSYENFPWKDVVPKPVRYSTRGLLREIVNHLSKVRGHEMHPLIKISMERFRPSWPLPLALLLPRRKVFVETIIRLRYLRSTRNLRAMFQYLTVEEKREIKTIAVLHQRGSQLEICYDERLPLKNAVTDGVRDATSVCICQFCSSVLTYVDLKNRPPIKGVYYDNETLRYRCGNCNSRNVFKFPLVDSDSTCRVGQADLPSVGVCAGARDCFNLVAVPRGICGTCYRLQSTSLSSQTSS